MRQLLPLLAAVAIAGCASAPVGDVPRQLFADPLFARTERPPVDDDIFAVSDAMKTFADERIAGQVERLGHTVLSEAIKREIRIDYDSSTTRAAAGTFDERAGNCLALVILTGAFAKYFDLPFDYQSVYGKDTWTRSQRLAFLSGHVNIRMRYGGADGVTIDFVEQASYPPPVTHVISEATVRAMYLNNRAAEALVADDPASYWWARAAIETEPGYAAAVNTLGVVYLRSGALREAERALGYVLEREPDNVIALTNLAQVYARLGQDAEVREIRARLAAIEPYPPFYFLDQGLAALERGEYDKARAFLTRELRRMPFNDEVHFALALADLREGQKDAASHHLSLALKYSNTRERRDIYSAKLSSLRSIVN